MNIVLIVLSLFISQANAVKLAMEPQNRVFVGGSWIDGGFGPTVSLESRLTQLIYIGMGGFGSTSPNIGDIESSNQQDWVSLHHGIWAAPGWRIPHRYKANSLNWDVLLRGGFACVFTRDAYRDDFYLVDPAGLVGIDLYLHKGNVGIRSSNKMFLYQPNLTKTLTSISAQRLQSSIELFWQWG